MIHFKSIFTTNEERVYSIKSFCEVFRNYVEDVRLFSTKRYLGSKELAWVFSAIVEISSLSMKKDTSEEQPLTIESDLHFDGFNFRPIDLQQLFMMVMIL